jgi:molybdopterin-binding protein
VILAKHVTASAGKLGAIVREYGSAVPITQFRVSEVAALLGVSDDTVRRWADAGRLTRTRTSGGPALIDGAEVARLAQELAAESALHSAFPTSKASARNRITGIVTKVTKDGVMAQVELQAGPFRLVSLMSREAADELGLVPGSLAVASAKATTIVVEVPQ